MTRIVGMASQSRKVERSLPKSGRAADTLFRKFEQMIISGELKEGEPLPPEREIVEAYGVSRTVAREAILALANRGLVDARPRFRPTVRKADYGAALETIEHVVRHLLNTPGGVKNLFETRVLTEAMLVREAAIKANKEDIQNLKRALDANEAAIEDSEEFYKTDMAFHRSLFMIAGNPVLPVVHQAYTSWLAPHWSRMLRQPDRNQENFEAHRAIFEAILFRDPDAAEAALRSHLANAWGQLRKTFGDI